MKQMIILSVLCLLTFGCESTPTEKTCQFNFAGDNVETHCDYTFTGNYASIPIDEVGTVSLRFPTEPEPGIYRVLPSNPEVVVVLRHTLESGIVALCVSGMSGEVEITEEWNILINVYLTCDGGNSYRLMVLE